MARTEAQKKSQKDYMAKIRQVMVKFNSETEADELAFLESKGQMQTYIKRLIREDMKRELAKRPSMAETTSTTWKKLFELPMTPGQLINSHERFKACRKLTDYFETEEELNEILRTEWAEICRDGIIIWADMA
jgi:hypothetical protein